MQRNCLTCFKDIKSNYIRLDNDTKSVEIRRKLAFCVPNAVFHVVNNPILCYSCNNALNLSYLFISQCRSTDERILKYMQNNILLDHKNESLELKNVLVQEKLNCKRIHLQDNTNINLGTKKINGSSTYNDKRSENLSQSQTELCEHESSSYLENEQSISKFLEIKLEYDSESATFNNIDNFIKSEVSYVENKENLSFIHSKDTKITKDCYVKLTRLHIKQAPEPVIKTVIKVKKNSSSQYQCSLCDYNTTINSNFRRHIRIHNNDKPYSCEKCDYKTSIKCNLQSHMATHSKTKPYQCDHCQFSTTHPSNLKQHLYIHGDKTFHCNDCDFSTTNKNALKKHIPTHADTKIYQCDKCKLNFSEKYKLYRHKLTHAKGKAYECEFCEYSSIRTDTLKRHIKRKHEQ